MTVIASALALFADAALAGALGVMTFFSFVGAPRAFAVLGTETAGEYVNDVFPRYYRVNLSLAAASIAPLAVAGSGDGSALVGVLLAPACALLAAACHGVAYFWLVPRMDAAGEDAFERYHGWSVGLNGVAMVAVAATLVAARL